MRKKAICLALVFMSLISGCGNKNSTKQEIEEDFKLELTSAVDKEHCFICGNPPGGLLECYAKCDSVGIIHWEDMSVVDTRIREYDEAGNEILNHESINMTMSSFGEDCGSVSCTPQTDRGIFEGNVYLGEKDVLDYKKLEDKLCQKCLDKVAEFYEDQVNSGDEKYNATTGFCLIDFATGDLYTLSEPYRGYNIRDYFVRYDLREQGDGSKFIDLLIVYAPPRSS